MKKLFFVAILFSLTAWADADWNGHSNYRLIFLNSPGEFNANEDVLTPSLFQKQLDEVRQALTTATFKALVPAIGKIAENKSNYSQVLMASVGNIQQELAVKLSKIKLENDIEYNVMLVPWDEKIQLPFYKADKVSMSANEAANFLGSSPRTSGFNEKLTAKMKSLQNQFFLYGNEPVSLISMMFTLTLKKSGEKDLLVQVLTQLKEAVIPFNNTNDKVVLDKIVIPAISQKGVSGLFTFDIDLNAKTDPKLIVNFGDFDRYAEGFFLLDKSNLRLTGPRIEGLVNKNYLKKVGINFMFSTLIFNLKTLDLVNLKTMISPGLRIKGTNFTRGAFHVESIDTEFQNEINKTIDSEIDKAVKGGEDKIFGGMVTHEMLLKTFNFTGRAL
jgi:hypothetical protein